MGESEGEGRMAREKREGEGNIEGLKGRGKEEEKRGDKSGWRLRRGGKRGKEKRGAWVGKPTN